MRKVEQREYSPGQRADRRALAEIVDLIDDGEYEPASVMAWELQRATPGDPAIWLLLTRIDYLRERYAGAMYAARMATRLDPSSADAWLWLARTAATRARWRTEGLDAALQATALAPDDPRTWTALAELHLAYDARYEAAIAAERAVRVGPDDVDAHRMLGQIALHAEEWRHAVAAFRRALRISPDDAESRGGLVTALEALHIDPSGELDRYGPPAQQRRQSGGRGPRIRQLTQESLDLAAVTRAPARRRSLLIGVAVCAVAGALLGIAVPGIGLTRGLAAAAAVILMWVAIWPQRRRPRPRAEAADAIATDGDDADDARPAAARAPARPAEPTRPAQPAQRMAARVAQPAPSVAPEPAGAPTSRPAVVAPAARTSLPPPRRPTRPDPAPDRPEPAATPAARDGAGTEKTPAGGTGRDRTPASAPADARRVAAQRPRRLKRPPQDEPAEPTRPAFQPAGGRAPAATDGSARDDAPADPAVEPADPAMEPADPAVQPAATAPPPGEPERTADAGPDAAEAPPSDERAGETTEDDRAGVTEDDRADGADGLPDDPAELAALSEARLADFDLEAAGAAAARLAELAPDSLEAHRALAAVALAAQDYPQAELHYGKVLEIEPLDQEAHERLSMARKGRRREEQQRHRRRKG